ncbi:MAG TPA: LEA type 2 family protein, partial [Thermodesulfobacteriota bacterium]|nr:LEA type 2 family protein [Thermodesulfobacteriota bacterium]
SCSPSFNNPQVEITKVRVVKITSKAVVLEGTLDLYNPNDQSLQFSGYEYTLVVENRKLVTGESKEPMEIAGLKHSTIVLPATIRFEDLSALLADDLLNRNISYRLSGTVHFNHAFGTTPLSFSQEGTFNLSEVLKEKVRELLSRW